MHTCHLSAISRPGIPSFLDKNWSDLSYCYARTTSRLSLWIRWSHPVLLSSKAPSSNIWYILTLVLFLSHTIYGSWENLSSRLRDGRPSMMKAPSVVYVHQRWLSSVRRGCASVMLWTCCALCRVWCVLTASRHKAITCFRDEDLNHLPEDVAQ